jgi:hypothetical protein
MIDKTALARNQAVDISRIAISSLSGIKYPNRFLHESKICRILELRAFARR